MYTYFEKMVKERVVFLKLKLHNHVVNLELLSTANELFALNEPDHSVFPAFLNCIRYVFMEVEIIFVH